MLTNANVVAESGNVKTGPITVTTRGIGTCPSTCPFLDADQWKANGCYGAGRIWYQANKAAHDVVDLPAATTLIRDRIVGDITVPEAGDDRIDWEYVKAVQTWAASRNSTVFGYTHATSLMDQCASWEWDVLFPDYTMNISCHTTAQVADVIGQGWDAVISSDDVAQGDMVGDKRIVRCPAVDRDDVTCKSCGLCAKRDRKAIIWFPLHGTQVKKAQAALAALQNEINPDGSTR